MNNYNITTIHMVTKVITIGSDPACDFVINNTTMPSYSRELVERILPVHAQIFQEDNIHYLKSFGDDICINEISVFSSLFEKMILNGDIQIVNHSVRLNFNDTISIAGLDIYWQQWMVGLGLKCGTCRYYSLRQSNDDWCQYCAESHYNPSPHIYGYSPKYSEDHGYFNYTDCGKCGFKPDWCVECNFLLIPEPKNRSYKEHIEMYLQRVKAKPAKP